MNAKRVFENILGLGPVIIIWAILVGWLAWLIYDRAKLSEKADEAALREWLDESRNFRKTLPEMIREILNTIKTSQNEKTKLRKEEIEEHLRALNEPIRTFPNQLPIFPEIFRIEILFAPYTDPNSQDDSPTIVYDSQLPRPRGQTQTPVRIFKYQPLGDDDQRATIKCWYRFHALNKLQKQDEDRRKQSFLAGALLIAGTVLASLYVLRFLRNQRAKQMQDLTALAEAEHRERELAETKLEKEKAEAIAAEMRTQMYANIGIMAGSYAHNIKNLLVRPNDLLSRCIEANGLSSDQTQMLGEVKGTLGTVTERLQQILATVRRDPTETNKQRIDLNQLVKNAVQSWEIIAKEKWKVTLNCQLDQASAFVNADPSNIMQIIENLTFNARDATFEMRNRLREQVRQNADLNPQQQREQLISVAAWRGLITLTTKQSAESETEKETVVLEIKDNGIGMTEEVREKCLTTHFSTKRDNALYEGHAAGMGLGLSFVSMVCQHHSADIEIISKPNEGAIFRITFPKTNPALPNSSVSA